MLFIIPKQKNSKQQKIMTDANYQKDDGTKERYKATEERDEEKEWDCWTVDKWLYNTRTEENYYINPERII